ncbi:hypothetical protein K5D47_13940 [Pseudomonas cichorii]|nr:hypothetical protein [Pseudomonas cichorii]MBX8495881.1 hypothetical protein [Pseudomonas cichorii]MBX8515120.1 hypothetical protein [Pseudomonas cichorii]MBX8575710.1 hypothetical protein [Pseudomonas cichorii]QVE15412.1 hypothetical protein KGD89_16090 [Pseudomonas cichorii]
MPLNNFRKNKDISVNKFLALLAIVFSLSLQGCMTYSHHELTPAGQWPLAAAKQEKPAVYLKVLAEYAHNDNAMNTNTNIAGLEKLLLQEFKDSQRFSGVTTEQQSSDVYVTATLRNHEEGNLAGAFLTGFTLFLIPNTFDNTLSLELTFRDKDGKKLGQVRKQEKLTTWVQLLLIFAVPFNESTDMLVKQLARSALEEAAAKGLI